MVDCQAIRPADKHGNASVLRNDESDRICMISCELGGRLMARPIEFVDRCLLRVPLRPLALRDLNVHVVTLNHRTEPRNSQVAIENENAVDLAEECDTFSSGFDVDPQRV